VPTNNHSTNERNSYELRIQTCAAIAIVAFILAVPASASADAVSDWNAIAVQSTVTGARPGPTGVLDIAMAQAAVYDAVQAIDGRFKPYHVEIPGPLAHRSLPLRKPRMMYSSAAFQRRPHPSTRLTINTWRVTSWLRTILG